MKEITEEKVKTRIGEIQEDYEKVKKDKDKKYFEEQKGIEERTKENKGRRRKNTIKFFKQSWNRYSS